MDIKLIKTEKDYYKALERLELIFDAEPNTPEGDEATIIEMLIGNYEKKHYPIEAPDPIEAIKFRMEQMGMDPKDLIPVVGSKSLVSRLLNKKRPLSVDVIRRLSKSLNLSADTLIKEYETI